MENNITPSRLQDESFEQYKQRQRQAKKYISDRAKGQLVFNSQNIILDKVGKPKGFSFKKGKTFVRPAQKIN